MIRLQVRAVYEKRGLASPFCSGAALEIADQGTGARRRVLGPGHSGVEPGHPHLEIAPVLLEPQRPLRCQRHQAGRGLVGSFRLHRIAARRCSFRSS
jgi:hypothetical protein